MSSWNETTVGLRVKAGEEKLAEQFLVCLGINTKQCGVKEVGEISADFKPSVEGVLNGGLLGIAAMLERHYSQYIAECYSFYGGGEFEDEEWDDEDEEDYEDEEWDDDDEEECEEEEAGGITFGDEKVDLQLDDLFRLTNMVFPSAYVFLAHEEGNNTSDDYYRYEVILDPTSKKKIECDCFYSYGSGINVSDDDDDPKEKAAETNEEAIASGTIPPDVMEWLIERAQNERFPELVARLNACK